MSLLTFIRAKRFTSTVFLALLMLSDTVLADWAIDMSRRRQEMRQQELLPPQPREESASLFEKLLGADRLAGDIVILNTDKGFVPDTVRLTQGMKYRIHVVNVNESEKNVSFILDAFSEHHATYYGQIKTFHVEPREEGVHSYQCPETAMEGRMVVYQSKDSAPRLRRPASVE